MSDFLWVEQYRPQTIDECILPTDIKETFQSFVDRGEISNLLLAGPPGCGKTTVARALCEQMGADYMFINGSEESGIDTLRTKIKNFASTVSLSGGKKVVILDEADYLNPQSTQPAMRGFIEEFHKNCRFILTCNFKNRIIEPLHSRCGVYEFNTTKKEMAELAAEFFKRFIYILNQEGVTFEKNAAADLVMKYAPDWRRVLNEGQRSGFGNSGINGNNNGNGLTSISDLAKHLKEKDFKKMRHWVANNMDVDASSIFRGLYDNMSEIVASRSIPQLVLILADYQYKHAFVADHELNVVACMTEIMANVEFN